MTLRAFDVASVATRAEKVPLFREPLYVGRPNLGDHDRILARFSEILNRRRLTNNGPCVQQFESAVAAYLGVRHCIAVCNATIGLQLTTRALGLSGEVIVPSFTFPATAHALAWQGIRPVFCDVDPATHNIDPDCVERLIRPATAAILGVHLWGNPCAVDELQKIASRHGLALFFDAAHALGCGYSSKMIGNFGCAEIFSFHATKFVSAGEGGAITTNDDELAGKLRRLRNFGIDGESVTGVGINAKMCEFAAAIGIESLERCPDYIARNEANLAAYQAVLAGTPGLSVFTLPTAERRNNQYIVVEVDEQVRQTSRDALVAALHAENIFAKRYFSPGCHRMEPYRASHDAIRDPLPHTERLCDRLMQLPTGTAVSESDIARIGDFLRYRISRARSAA